MTEKKDFGVSRFFFSFLVMVVVDGKPVRLQLYDTAGQVSSFLASSC